MRFNAGPVPMSFANVGKLRPTPSSDELIRQVNQIQLEDFDRRLATDDLGSLDSGTEVAIADKSYLITEIEPVEDGQVTRLMMEEL
jgi:hypothetical protein